MKIMHSLSFDRLLTSLLKEYESAGTLMQVPVSVNGRCIPVGPAAGPHTQLAGNIIASYAAGATCFELKTVQIIDGENLVLQKPCIYVGAAVFNTEWSTELTVEHALDEYIRAYILIQVLGTELELTPVDAVRFYMSVGYDLQGIQSGKIQHFLDSMKDASVTEEWQKDIAYLREHIGMFRRFDAAALESLEKKTCVSGCVTLSTMHGCPAGEIQDIALYLLREKNLDTYIKLNPTLCGKETARGILSRTGCADFAIPEDVFDTDIDVTQAAAIVDACRKAALACGRTFGVKMTNTLPLHIRNGELSGERMYMSGPSLYALSLSAADALLHHLEQPVPVSFSGGVDESNINDVLRTGIAPVTICSVMLQPGGYRHLSSVISAVQDCDMLPSTVQKDAVHAEVEKLSEPHAVLRKKKTFSPSAEYDSLCARCTTCVDVCPNRANIRIRRDGKKVVVHVAHLCNECGCCAELCPLGHSPYTQKSTIFNDEEDYSNFSKDIVHALVSSDGECICIAGESEQKQKELASALEAGKWDLR